jgi:rhodanese-related sulfurtransferase
MAATIAPARLAQLLAENPGLDVIDVRTPLEFNEVHVAAAKNLPLDSLSPTDLVHEGVLSEDEPVYILCQSGQRATKAAEKFARDGFPNAIVVEGGTQGWVGANLPVIRGHRQVISLERQIRIAAGGMVFFFYLLGRFVHPFFFTLAGLIGLALVITGITGWCGMGLLLAKAPWNNR